METGGARQEEEEEREQASQATPLLTTSSFFFSFETSLSFQLATHTTMTSSADRINLGELTSQLANAEACVCEWASAAGKRADAARLEHGRRIAALRGK